jgi:transposase
MSADVAVPANITLVPQPPKCPEFNAIENVWPFTHTYIGRDCRDACLGLGKNCSKLGNAFWCRL